MAKKVLGSQKRILHMLVFTISLSLLCKLSYKIYLSLAKPYNKLSGPCIVAVLLMHHRWWSQKKFVPILPFYHSQFFNINFCLNLWGFLSLEGNVVHHKMTYKKRGLKSTNHSQLSNYTIMVMHNESTLSPDEV